MMQSKMLAEPKEILKRLKNVYQEWQKKLLKDLEIWAFKSTKA